MNTPEEFEHCAARVKAVADSTRLQIISVLLAGPKYVGDIAKAMNGGMSQISHHLGVLRDAGILVSTKHGRFIEYALRSCVYLPSGDATAEYSIDLGECRLMLPAADEPPAPRN